MTTLAAGDNVTLTLTDNDSVTIHGEGVMVVEAVSGLGITAGRIAEFTGSRTFGPYEAGALKIIASVKSCEYERADGPLRTSSFRAPVILAQSGVASSVTGTTNETTLATITVPGGMMGANGAIKVSVKWQFTNSANNKNLKLALGGSTIFSANRTTSATEWWEFVISNAGAANSQINTVNPAPFSASTGAFGTSSVDTSADKSLILSGTLANSGETITVLAYSFEVLPA